MKSSFFSLCLLAVSVLGTQSGTADGSIGLVLSGGGAKGAYEVGVWKAMCERGLDGRVKAISGTSIGAVNAVLFTLVKDEGLCRDLWKRSIGRAFCVNGEVVSREIVKTVDDVAEIQRQRDADLKQRLLDRQRKLKRTLTSDERESIEGDVDLEYALSFGFSLLLRVVDKAGAAVDGKQKAKGVLDSRSFRKVLVECIPSGIPSRCPAVYATAVAKASGRRKVFDLRGLTKEEVLDRLMASAAFPGAFDSVEIDGVAYIDGGFEARGGSNVPVEPILEQHHDVRTIVVVAMDPHATAWRSAVENDVSRRRLIEIRPSEKIDEGILGGVFDSSPERLERLIRLGYKDARRALDDL